MKKVIVTGANGFLASALIKKLTQKGISVVAISRKFSNSCTNGNSLVQNIEMDILNIDEQISLIPQDSYDAFYHFAWAGVNGPDKADPIVQLRNIEMTVKCARVAKTLAVKKFLCAGTIAERAVESLPNLTTASGGMMYGVAKYTARLMIETLCKNIGLDFVWMQFSNIYGPLNKTGNLVSYTIEKLQNNDTALFGPANQPYDFIYIDDLLRAVIRLGECLNEEQCYFIGSGKPRILREYLNDIGGEMKCEHLIKIGSRPDDGIKYSIDMFDTSQLVNLIGKYAYIDFKEGIKIVLNHN
ncbi:epimerase [Flavonifractor sp. An52]|uniref:NAD-dependent epimerase/dehydratase family protein n=1 Tax=Flavonifractor sp. An52 TaxID=1965642 RepID=UPI000B38DA00|nr:NAD(P)-dependent oxidoreductase [Flavonifractor sp. An52]OUN79914.1 epimerase [Flavonifractor sp. An52]